MAECIQLTQLTYDDCENMCTLSFYHHQIRSITHLPLLRVMSWNNGMCCMSFYILMIHFTEDTYHIHPIAHPGWIKDVLLWVPDRIYVLALQLLYCVSYHVTTDRTIMQADSNIHSLAHMTVKFHASWCRAASPRLIFQLGWYPTLMLTCNLLTMQFGGLVQERCNSSALAMELCLSWTNPLT